MVHVLVVDDDEAVRYVFGKYLARAGYAVRTAGTGDEAIAAAHAGRVDVLVTDQRMPGMPGDALIGWFRSNRPGVPALLVTAYAGEVAAGLAGVRVMNKPVSGSELIEAVRSAAGQS
ncbi:response regulator [Massilia sp. METH4]|uniref:response regulator n=1 Tax=Massilia sp. METH4 TaxID=3123041 RepID=UPI0030D55C8F